MNNTTMPMSIFGTSLSADQDTSTAEPDLAQRLRADSSGQLRGDLFLRLDDMQARLRSLASRGADGETWTKIEAGLEAVAAARDIMTRMPVTANPINSADAVSADPFRRK